MDNLIYSIDKWEDCVGYKYSFYNKTGECIARLSRKIATSIPYWEGDDITLLDISSEVELCSTSANPRHGIDQYKQSWRKRLIGTQNMTHWLETRSNYETHYGGGHIYKLPFAEIKEKLLSYKNKGSDHFL